MVPQGKEGWLSPPQGLICPCYAQGISEDFRGEGGKMVVETTGGYLEKAK